MRTRRAFLHTTVTFFGRWGTPKAESGRKPAAAFDRVSWCELDFVFVVQDPSGMSAVRTARVQVFLTPKSHQKSAEIIGSATAIFTKALKTLG